MAIDGTLEEVDRQADDVGAIAVIRYRDRQDMPRGQAPPAIGMHHAILAALVQADERIHVVDWDAEAYGVWLGGRPDDQVARATWAGMALAVNNGAP